MSTLMFNVEDAEEELLCRALYVDEDDIDVDESQPPATAEEYLKRVMKEAQQIKDVARAPNMDQILKRSKKGSVQASNRVEGNRSKATVLNISLPTPEWQKKQVIIKNILPIPIPCKLRRNLIQKYKHLELVSM